MKNKENEKKELQEFLKELLPEVDPEIRPLVSLLNEIGIYTTESCAGHLDNGNEKNLSPYISFMPLSLNRLRVLAHSIECLGQFPTKLPWKIEIQMYYENLSFNLNPGIQPSVKEFPRLLELSQKDLKILVDSIKFHFDCYQKKTIEKELEKCIQKINKIYSEFSGVEVR